MLGACFLEGLAHGVWILGKERERYQDGIDGRDDVLEELLLEIFWVIQLLRIAGLQQRPVGHQVL